MDTGKNTDTQNRSATAEEQIDAVQAWLQDRRRRWLHFYNNMPTFTIRSILRLLDSLQAVLDAPDVDSNAPEKEIEREMTTYGIDPAVNPNKIETEPELEFQFIAEYNPESGNYEGSPIHIVATEKNTAIVYRDGDTIQTLASKVVYDWIFLDWSVPFTEPDFMLRLDLDCLEIYQATGGDPSKLKEAIERLACVDVKQDADPHKDVDEKSTLYSGLYGGVNASEATEQRRQQEKKDRFWERYGRVGPLGNFMVQMEGATRRFKLGNRMASAIADYVEVVVDERVKASTIDHERRWHEDDEEKLDDTYPQEDAP